jgi:signal transduction histidine kinase
MPTVRAQATAVAVLVVGLALAALGIGLVIVVRDTLAAQVDDDEIAVGIAEQLQLGELPPIIPLPGGQDDQDDVFIQVMDAQGRVVASTANYAGHPAALDQRPALGAVHRSTRRGLAVDTDDTFRLMATTVDTPAGPATILVGTEYEQVVQTVSSLRRALRIGAPLLLVLAGALVWVLVGRSLRPVESIRVQVSEIAMTPNPLGPGRHRRVPEPPTNDEIGRLARTMNGMLERLEDAAARQRRFVSDASHELRSPLALSRTELEVALAHPHATDWPAVASELLAENGRMERLITDLLLLARTDERDRAPGGAGRAEAVDVDEIVLAEIGRFEGSPAGLAATVDISAVSGGRVCGNGDQLTRVVRNLLENARRHARRRVAVELRQVGEEVLLAVCDDGPGVPEADRDRIFERFVRLDDARSRHGGGSGLGLAIVRGIVVHHGGRLWVEDNPGGGARFVVRLPAA